MQAKLQIPNNLQNMIIYALKICPEACEGFKYNMVTVLVKSPQDRLLI